MSISKEVFDFQRLRLFFVAFVGEIVKNAHLLPHHASRRTMVGLEAILRPVLDIGQRSRRDFDLDSILESRQPLPRDQHACQIPRDGTFFQLR